MVKSENIDYAIRETLKSHPEFKEHLTQMLLRNIQREIYLNNFTKDNGARDKVEGLRDIDLVNYIIENLVKIVNAGTYYLVNDPEMALLLSEEKHQRLMELFPGYGDALTLLSNSCDCNKILYFLTNPIQMLRAIDCVTTTMFDREDVLDYINGHGKDETTVGIVDTNKITNELEIEYTTLEKLGNLYVNKNCYNTCVIDLQLDKQLVNKNNEYSLYGELYASQNVGKRQNQEDSVVIMEHPSNPKYKLLAVADGIGSAEYGDKASMYTLKELSKWFEVLPPEIFTHPNELQELFNKKITKISDEIYKEYNKDGFKAGSTFTGAIVADSKTIISTIGDSRAYTLNQNGVLNLVTRDESAVWPPRRSAQELGPDFIDDLRFTKGNNRIVNSVGYKIIEQIQCYQLDNNSYDKLLLLTDGVTDLLTTERIRFIAQTTSKNAITKMLVDEAISKQAVRENGADEEHIAVVNEGKDNATAAAFVRR